MRARRGAAATARAAGVFNESIKAYRGRRVTSLHFTTPKRQQPLALQNKKRASLFVSNKTSLTSTRPSVILSQKPKSDKLIILLGAFLVGSFTIFALENTRPVFYTNRLRLMGMSWEAERKLFASSPDCGEGEGEKEECAKKEAGGQEEDGSDDGALVEDEFSREIERIAWQIINACERDFIEVRGKLPWRIYTRENDVANAFNAPGGKLTIFTGLIDLCCEAELAGQLDDARNGLACILAHEIAHGYCRHGVEKLSWLPIQFLYFFFSKESLILDYFFQYIVSLPHSRLCESEADAVGMDLMARAGFDPSEGLKMWSLLGGSELGFEFLSTHPSGGSRTQEWERGLDRAMAIYQANRNRNAIVAAAEEPTLWNKLLGGGGSKKSTSLAVRWAERGEKKYVLKQVKDVQPSLESAAVKTQRPLLKLRRRDTTPPASPRPARKPRQDGEDESIA